MISSPILLLSGFLLLTIVILKLFGQKYALDNPETDLFGPAAEG